ncbi:ABC transporter permease [Calidifontibacter sp. DB0510]|uniref:ABC transporter permease n=1 Tax=Metallococcus carri TaxID=1656884 RepID=A0A967B2C6_9MICO|nr:ABC transporter permease [Metallococcus carri]NHN56005.1 ABC transporter permease [Metallococcus carri]NOP37538.1 ABC transporter permease [Calidifontibacter sp. DB2511S]
MTAASPAAGPAHDPRQEGAERWWQRFPLARYVLVRLVVSVLLIWGVTLVTFVLTNLVPSNPAAAALGERAASNPDTVKAFERQYGLDQPVPQQYVSYLGRLVHLNLGQSTQTHNAVWDDLRSAFPATAELAVTALVIAAVLAIVLGLAAALRRGSILDQVVRVGSLIGFSTPTFWLALVIFYVFSYKLGWFPGSGRLDPQFDPPPQRTGFYTIDALLAGQIAVFVNAVEHLVLPAFVLVLYTLGILTRFCRTAVLEVLGNDYVTAARAKGLPRSAVTRRYILRAAAVPILTMIGLTFASVLSGAVLTETVFAWGGIGQYAYKAATTLDLQAIMGVGLLIGIIYVVVNFIVDLLYGVLDPRVRDR